MRDDELLAAMWRAFQAAEHVGHPDGPMAAILAVVREHDGRDAARFEWLVSKRVDVSYNPTPDDEVEIKLCINHDNDPRLVYHAGSDLRAAIDAARPM